MSLARPFPSKLSVCPLTSPLGPGAPGTHCPPSQPQHTHMHHNGVSRHSPLGLGTKQPGLRTGFRQ